MSDLKWRIAQFAELRWWKRYLGGKNKAQYLAWKQQYWQAFLQQIQAHLWLPNRARLLDAGCGPAGIFMVLAPNHSVTAIDPLLAQYQQHLTHFSPADYPTVQFAAITLEQLTEKEQYDAIFCLNAINHVANLPLCLDNLQQALQPNGKLIMSIDAHNYSFFKRLFRLLPGDILHPHQYDLSEYQAMLQQKQIAIEQVICLKKAFFFDYYVIVGKRVG
jgi:2-polyprenyl-3-methyl-5-hydroxy-6-metoxy-1,4-benzoquinol methylase